MRKIKTSEKGYKRDSPDKRERALNIPSNHITMDGVDHPILGIDNLGNHKLMMPGDSDYIFPGNNVTEYPIRQTGGSVEEQRTWLRNYLSSPKYKERLSKELLDQPQSYINNEIESRIKNLDRAKIKYVSSIGSKPGYIAGMYVPRDFKPFEEDLNSYKGPNISDRNFWPGNIYLEKGTSQIPGYETTPLHEMGHAVDNGGSRIAISTRNLVDRNTQSDILGDTTIDTVTGNKYGYLDNPTEFINRLQPIRYLLDKEGIYKAGSQDFDDNYFDKMMQNENIQRNSHFKDVMETLNGKTDKEKKKQFIMMMNSIASNSGELSDRSMQSGGQIFDDQVDDDIDESEKLKYGGQRHLRGLNTSKNIKSSLNYLMRRNYIL